MTIEKMREALVRYYDAEGQMQPVDLVHSMSDDEITRNYERFLVSEQYEMRREKLDEDTVQKKFDLDKARGKID